MIYDCFIIRDEIETLELRMKILGDVVDKFVICEANKTFTNVPKPYNFLENYPRFQQWEDKIIYVTAELNDDGLDFSQNDASYSPTSAAWQFEYQQRNGIIGGLDKINDDDIILMGDVDEIPNPLDIKSYDYPVTFVMDFYYYFVNNKSINVDRKWFGTVCTKGIHLKNGVSIQDLRNQRTTYYPILSGWHWSYLGGKEAIRTKIKSFSHTEYNSEKYYGDENIDECLKTGKDLFNRPGQEFQLVDIASQVPPSILDIINKYPHLIYSKS